MSVYAELQAASNYSFLRGASHPQELIERAAALGHHAIAITDRNSLGGVVRAHIAARENVAAHEKKAAQLKKDHRGAAAWARAPLTSPRRSGRWFCGQQDGMGKVVYSDGSRFEGLVRKNSVDSGRMWGADGLYTGSLRHGRRLEGWEQGS